MKKLLIKSNMCSLGGHVGYFPRVSSGTWEECEGFQKFLENVLSVYRVPFKKVEVQDWLGNFIMIKVDTAYKSAVETILFHNYRNRFVCEC